MVVRGLWPTPLRAISLLLVCAPRQDRRDHQRPEVPTEVLVRIRIDADRGEDDRVAPPVRKAVPEVRARLRDPAPVPADGLHLAEGGDGGAADEGHRPDRQAQQGPPRLGDAVEPGLPPDHEERRDPDGQDGEVGRLDGELPDPAVEGAGCAGAELVGPEVDRPGNAVVQGVDEVWLGS